MRYFIVYAHPEPRSLNGALRDAAVTALQGAGHEVVVSDLYAMRFKAVADAEDFPRRPAEDRLIYHRDSGEAYAAGALADDVAAEIARLEWADVVVLQFPLWWWGPPAILKGWLDRVLVSGFAIGVPKPGVRRWLRYGEGRLAGRRGLLAVTTGGRESQFGPRGVNGPIEDLLFPLTHGVFHYVGVSPLEPFVAFRTARATEAEFAEIRSRYVARLLAADREEPLRYRFENGGDYDDAGRLRDDCAPGLDGYRAHVISTPADPERPK